MRYDFDEQITRRGTDSYKWDSAESENVLPMWVADMDFRTAPVIVEALRRRVEHGIFGYTRVPDSCFFSSIRNNGCERVSSPLVFANNTYAIDYEDLERKASDPKVKVMLLCNPHNPAGRVWKREELVHIGEICIRHGVTVVSDEIHCELVFPGHRYTPFASLSEEFLRHSVTCLSPSKAFNIAGLQIANIVCADAGRQAKIDRAINDNEVCDVNPFGVIATQAAYNEGEEWLNQLIEYLHANYLSMQEFCRVHLPEFPVTVLEGTYLVWMDCRKLGMSSDELERRLVSEAGLWLNAGTMYGTEGEGFMRWNIACPRNTLTEGLKRFADFVHSINVKKPNRSESPFYSCRYEA